MSVLVINPGSTSTKLAVFENGNELASTEIQHDKADLTNFARVADQFDFRMQAITRFLKESSIDVGQLQAVAGRGGLLRPLEGGVYVVSDDMVNDLKKAIYGEHPCNLGAPLALSIAKNSGIPAYVVDPVVTDEMMDTARITGLPEIERRSLFHALNQRGVARLVAERLNKAYEKCDFIVCHMGGGISIGAHNHGRIVDVINGLDGEGPFTPERTGALPILPVLDLLRNDEMGIDELQHAVVRQGGLFAHLGTNDPREVVARIQKGDKKAQLIFKALAYTIAKHIAAMTPALADDSGAVNVTSIILTGGLARSEPLVKEITRMVSHLGVVEVMPGEVEMVALAAGAERAICGEEPASDYQTQD